MIFVFSIIIKISIQFVFFWFLGFFPWLFCQFFYGFQFYPSNQIYGFCFFNNNNNDSNTDNNNSNDNDSSNSSSSNSDDDDDANI